LRIISLGLHSFADARFLAVPHSQPVA